ncbi:MAG TPA: carbohydrate ABC transporter permease [Spirochaetales bacterium]|nr:carbohydrate ABC transporter permease [Spirochaetales bacterium]HRY56161.1 carbohydrate ABC transporter permease [Spirochaetia bacterium]HRZ65632.1 carbohydrate ABC transporter permease [Spirochaetia bacterium]
MRAILSALKALALCLVAAVFLLPMLWLVLSSFKGTQELVAWPPRFLPKAWTLANYAAGLRYGDFPRFFANTAIATAASTLLSVSISAMAGYAFAKYRFPGRDAIFVAILATLMFSLEVILIPMFLTLKQFGLINSLWGIIIPPAATPTGIFLMRQYCLGLPDELLEAARMDGAGEGLIFARVVLPLAGTVLSTLTIFSFVWRWNDFMWPFLVINDDELQTVQLALANFVGQYAVEWGGLLAMTSLSMLPMLLVFLVFQRYFMKGIAMTGLKA